MLIGICGTICAGKSTVADYLVERHGFTRLYLSSDGNGRAGAERGGGSGGGSGGSSDTTSGTPASPNVFAHPEAMLEFVTAHWRDRWVTTAMASEAVLDIFHRRPFFLLICVDAPVAVRWRRAKARAAGTAAVAPSLEQFVARSDEQLYGSGSGSGSAVAPLMPLMARSALRLMNGGAKAGRLFDALEQAGLTADGVQELLRPSWDRYFMALAALAAQRSNCMKRRVGCVLVREHRVISTGYNGTPRGLRNCGEGGCGRCNTGGTGTGAALATCLCLHAEENALLEAGRERIPPAALLYCDTCPCLTCSIKIVQVGIREVVYSHGYSMDEAAAAVFREAGVKLRQFVPPVHGIIDLDKIELP